MTTKIKITTIFSIATIALALSACGPSPTYQQQPAYSQPVQQGPLHHMLFISRN